MSTGNSTTRQAQLDKEEREHLEDVVTDLRDIVEEEIEYELEHQYDLTDRDGGDGLSDEEQATRERLVEAIDHENPGDKSWEWCYQQYINGVGYTFINRMAALRCMEVRDFIDRPVTQIGESGLTPAAERVLGERFDVGRDEALIIAFEEACERFDEEIELLFDTNSPYTVLDPDPDTFRRSIEQLDRISDEVWRPDDVLGWVYEYYNIELLDDLRRKGDREGFEPEDVPPANQFYTPHWVVRMLTDNSLGKLYLEDQGDLQAAVEAQDSLTPDERKNRPLSPDDSPDIADFCTYLVPSEEEGEPPDFDGPEDIRVIDPACGSGHFLLYAFDVLERIYRAETDLDPAEIPREILRNNLYGVDLDMRACQLAAFNLYLKGRMRAEAEGASGFDMPRLGIVCADAKVANVEGVEEVFDEVAGNDSEVKQALRRILDAFEEVHGLGSLLDVRGTLRDLFEDDSDVGGVQITLDDDPKEKHTLGQVLHSLRKAVEERRESNSFLAQDLRSFIRLLDILAQDYDVALMNPPYGSQNRMPDSVKKYVEDRYRYKPEFYINFFEVCDRISKKDGRIGMLVPRTFMFKQSFERFRKDFVGERGSFEFLSEFGIGILDNATVRTAGTVVRSTDRNRSDTGTFYRLHDVEKGEKENKFTSALCGVSQKEAVSRAYEKSISEFSMIPGSPISYWVPKEIRELYQSEVLLENRTDSDQASLGVARAGLQTSDDERFLRRFWEVTDYEDWKPYAKGGEDAWSLPRITYVTYWGENGKEVKRYPSSIVPNEQYYFKEVLAFTYIKEGGKRFGYLHPTSIFGHSGFVYIPDSDIWNVMSYLNSNMFTYLMIAQTTGRHWNVGEISKVPWQNELSRIDELEEYSKRAVSALLRLREHEFDSPYYSKPLLFEMSNINSEKPMFTHPHRDLKSDLPEYSVDKQNPQTLDELLEGAINYRQNIISTLNDIVSNIDATVFEELDIDSSVRKEILEEVRIRTSESPSEAPLDVVENDKYTNKLIEDVLIHAVLRVVKMSDDGIVPKFSTDTPLDELVIEYLQNKFSHLEGDIVKSIDSELGSELSSMKEYPNISNWIDKELFDSILDRFDNTPPVWEITTSRLVSDPKETGFECIVDYQQIDSGIMDRMINRYIDPKKEELRDRQAAANRRRQDDSLEQGKRAEAAEDYERYTNALEQITAFEDILNDLSDTNRRNIDPEVRDQAYKLAKKVSAFRTETKTRVEILYELREMKSDQWFEDRFSPKFWETVKKWNDEWMSALKDLENACNEYHKPADESVEAHLADLFRYYSDRVKGSDHYSSTGILFMTYYFEREGADLLDENGQPFENLTDDEYLLASLAMGLENSSIVDEKYLEAIADDEDVDSIDDLPPLAEYKALAQEIDDRCQTIYKNIPSEWKDRALSEITTTGYQPNHKHGVVINITPFAEQDIVPEVVDDKVL